MYDFKRVNNYVEFARMLEQVTGCSVKIKIMNRTDHIHYQLNDKYDVSLGVLCIDGGIASFAPFVTHETAQSEQYINVQYMVMFDEFINVLSAFKKIFVEETGVNLREGEENE